MDLGAAADFSCMLLEGWQKMERSENNPCKPEFLKPFLQDIRIYEGSSEYLKRSGCSPALAEIGRLKQAHARINSCCLKCRHIRGWHCPGKACIIKPHMP